MKKKTTVEIAASLLEEARKVATREGTTIKALIEQGLRKMVAERRRRASAFRLRKASFKGQGLQPGIAGASWERIREMATRPDAAATRIKELVEQRAPWAICEPP